MDAALPVCAQYGLAVAGGYAVKVHGLVERPSEDIDFATGTAAPIEEIVAALAAAYRRAELIAACRAAIDEEFSLETLRDQLAFAAAYPDEAFSRYGAGQELIVDVKVWALDWSTEIGLDIAESESWSDDENLGRTDDNMAVTATCERRSGCQITRLLSRDKTTVADSTRVTSRADNIHYVK